jgi:hypothetical protein
MTGVDSLIGGYYSLYNAFDGITVSGWPYPKGVINQYSRFHKQKQKDRNKKRTQKASRQKNRR